MSIERSAKALFHHGLAISEQIRIKKAVLYAIAEHIHLNRLASEYHALRSWMITSVRPVDSQVSAYLRTAVLRGHVDIVKFILEEALDVVGDDIQHLFVVAASCGYLELVGYFIRNHRCKCFSSLYQALIEASKHGHQAVVRELLSSFPDPVGPKGPLIVNVAAQGWSDIVESLIERGPIPIEIREFDLAQVDHPEIRTVIHRARVLEPANVIDPMLLTLSFEELKARPERWLQHLAGRGLPSRVRFIEFQDTTDLGGMLKRLISTLIESLIQKKVFTRTDSGLLSVHSAEDKKRLNQIGKLYSDLDKKNQHRIDKLLTGVFCHQRFFELVSIALNPKSEEEKLHDAAALIASIEPDQLITAQLILHPTAALKTEFQAIMMCPPGHDEIEARAIIGSYLTAAIAIYEGASTDFQLKMVSKPCQTLRDIQGEEASVERVLRGMVCVGDQERLMVQFRWLQTFIYVSTQKQRERFLKAVLGKSTFSAFDQIYIKQSTRQDAIFEFYPSFNSLELPQCDLTQEVFIEALINSVDDHDNTT